MFSDTKEVRDPANGVRKVAMLLGLLLVAALSCVASALLNDPDTQWHIAVGRLIAQTGAFPQTDTFSYTFAGAPWIAKEWLSQLILFAAFSAAGWWGVAILTVISVAMTSALLFAFLLARLKWTAALPLVLLALTLAAPEVVARPHIVVLPIVVSWMTQLIVARERGAVPPWWVAGLMTLWANLHASFPIGLVLAGLLAAEAVLASSAPEKRSMAQRWMLFLVASIVAACVSPYGYKPFVVALALSQNAETTRYINEWQPIGFDAQGLTALTVLFLSLAVLQREWRRNVIRTGAVALLGYMMIKHSRFTLLFGMITPILIADPIARAFRDLLAVPIRVPPAAMLGVALSCALVSVGIARPEPNPDVTPTAAFRYAEATGLKGHLYNDYDYGGFLIFNGVKTFIDGRSEQLFTGGFTRQLNEALNDPDDKGFAAILDRQNVSWALVKRGSQDAMHLKRMEGWSELFSEGSAAVFARTPPSSSNTPS